MSDALTQALLRRERILMRIAQQRDGVEAALAGLSGPVTLIDRALRAGRFLQAHPAAVAVVVAVAVALRGRGLLRMVSRGLGLWSLLRQVRTAASRLGL